MMVNGKIRCTEKVHIHGLMVMYMLVNNRDDKRDGNGTYTWASGDVYDGKWKDDKRNGKGTFTWNSGSWKGDVYVGEYKDDKKHGYGKYTKADGSIYHDGMFKDGKPVR